MSQTTRHRTKAVADKIVGISVAFEHDNLLSRGLGLEHLREAVLHLARPFVRQGASISYAGYWKEREENLTLDLLKLVGEEREDSSIGGPDAPRHAGRLINHSTWPFYLDITPEIEARWIQVCRIVRITQEDAGIAPENIVTDEHAKEKTDRVLLNSALTLSCMRRWMSTEISLPVPSRPAEKIPAPVARIVLGGKLTNYTGFAPGIFEESLYTLEKNCPLYILGGFGGAAESLANALLDSNHAPRHEFTEAWHFKHSPAVEKLSELAETLQTPADFRSTKEILNSLFQRVLGARADLPQSLQTGLDPSETMELLKTTNLRRAVSLVRKGLAAKLHLGELSG